MPRPSSASSFPGLLREEAVDDIRVSAIIQSGNGTVRLVPLHWVASATRWETTGNDRLPIELGAERETIEWSQNKNTLNLGGPTPTDRKPKDAQGVRERS